MSLDTIRQQIDAIDKKILQLLKERAELAIQVANEKRQSNDNIEYYRPEREAQILRRIVADNTSALSDESVQQIFRHIITACLVLQQPQTIAYLGPKGTFSEQAVNLHFGQGVSTTPIDSIDRIFREVEANRANYGVVPIENSTEGIVSQTLDALLNTRLAICGEIKLAIHLHLLRKPNDSTPLKKVYSHPQALAQCRQWLANHFPDAKTIATDSTTQAAMHAANETGAGAIAAETAEQYGLDIVTHHVEDNSHNTTRFLIVGKQHPGPSGKDKTSLVISTPHQPGALSTLLLPFMEQKINLTMIESRPYQQRNWRYIFFIDLEGHQEDAPVAKALTNLQQQSVMLQILGSYPRT